MMYKKRCAWWPEHWNGGSVYPEQRAPAACLEDEVAVPFFLVEYVVVEDGNFGMITGSLAAL